MNQRAKAFLIILTFILIIGSIVGVIFYLKKDKEVEPLPKEPTCNLKIKSVNPQGERVDADYSVGYFKSDNSSMFETWTYTEVKLGELNKDYLTEVQFPVDRYIRLYQWGDYYYTTAHVILSCAKDEDRILEYTVYPFPTFIINQTGELTIGEGKIILNINTLGIHRYSFLCMEKSLGILRAYPENTLITCDVNLSDCYEYRTAEELKRSFFDKLFNRNIKSKCKLSMQPNYYNCQDKTYYCNEINNSINPKECYVNLLSPPKRLPNVKCYNIADFDLSNNLKHVDIYYKTTDYLLDRDYIKIYLVDQDMIYGTYPPEIKYEGVNGRDIASSDFLYEIKPKI